MGNREIVRLFFIICAGFMSIAWLDQTADRVGEGNRLYERGKYDDALGKYTDVQINDPESPIIYFNIADAHYKKGKYDEAISAYEKASKSDDVTLEAKAYYNIGNAKYQQGKLNEALDYYKRAIELSNDPDAHGDTKAVNADAKYNHEFVEKKIKELMNKQKEQQSASGGQQEDKSQQEENTSQNPNEDKNKENQSASGGQKEQPESKEKREDQQSTSDRHSDDSDKEQEQNAPQSAAGQHKKHEMSEEDAERVLESLGRSEKEARKWIAERRHAIPGRVEKDW